MIKKDCFYSTKNTNNLWIYCLPFILSWWGILNVLYWEVYKGYSACTICKWHRSLYIALFVGSLLLFKWRKKFLKLMLVMILQLEMLVSLAQILGFNCDRGLCRRTSLADEINCALVVVTLGLIFLFELKTYLKRKHKLQSQVKQINLAAKFKVGRR